ncbi:MAG: hypothetical protein AB7U34_09680, partial [Novosphingobium sp.]
SRSAYFGQLDYREFNLMESNMPLAWMYVQLTNLGKGEGIDWDLTLENAPQAFADLENARETARRKARGEQLEPTA